VSFINGSFILRFFKIFCQSDVFRAAWEVQESIALENFPFYRLKSLYVQLENSGYNHHENIPLQPDSQDKNYTGKDNRSLLIIPA